jgi:hypothetical protein
VLFTPTYTLAQQLLAAKGDPSAEVEAGRFEIGS